MTNIAIILGFLVNITKTFVWMYSNMAREYCSLSDKIKIFEQHDYILDLTDVYIENV